MLRTRWPLTRVVSPRSGDGKSDELFTRKSHAVFAIFLASLSVIAGYLQYFGQPIHCWCPQEFTGGMVSYANSVCFFTDQYYLPEPTPIFPGPQPTSIVTNYFKWTPFGLLFLAALYIIPEILTHVTSKLFNLRLGNILKLAGQSTQGNKQKRDAAIEQLTFDLQCRLECQDDAKPSILRRLHSRILPSLPCYIRMQHIGTKFVLVLGSVMPIVFLYKPFQINFNYFADVTGNNNNGSNQTYFPSKILCDFEIRTIGTIHRYTLQCHLPASDMFERMAVLVGFLTLVVSSVSSSDFIVFLVTRLFESGNKSFMNNHLKLPVDNKSVYDQEVYEAFRERYLTTDGMYLIQLMGQNSGETVVSQIVNKLWEDYKGKLIQEKNCLPPPYSTVTDLN